METTFFEIGPARLLQPAAGSHKARCKVIMDNCAPSKYVDLNVFATDRVRVSDNIMEKIPKRNVYVKEQNRLDVAI